MRVRPVRVRKIGFGFGLVFGLAFAFAFAFEPAPGVEEPAPTPAPAESREQVRTQLDEERAGLKLLQSQKVGLLDLLEILERLSRKATARGVALELELSQLKRRIALAQRQEKLSTDVQKELSTRLSPRLWAMYRLERTQSLGILLSSADFASLVWRSRALAALSQDDLGLLKELQGARRFAQRSARSLALLREGLNDRLERIRTEQARAAGWREELSETLASIRTEAKHSSRFIRELEAAERQLSSLISEMEGQHAENTGFWKLRGRLPPPTTGSLEVGFGRVVNPKFNTVTVQKGVDLRSPLGTPVRAVAPGKVVFGAWLRGYGNVLIVDHGDGFHSLMAHLADFTVPVGATVEKGQEVGAVGDTGSLKGAYLYFELRHEGQAIDPRPWLAPSR